MEIIREKVKNTLMLSQQSYLEKVLKRFLMENAKAVGVPLVGHFKRSSDQCPKTNKEKEKMMNVPYASASGSLMYVMVCSRLDITHSVSVLSRFMANPGKCHWDGVKWLLRYIKGSISTCLVFGTKDREMVITRYVDSYFVRDLDRRRSTTGYIFSMCGGLISWKSQLQSIVALSSIKAEYIVAIGAVKEALWFQGLGREIGELDGSVRLFSDSQSAIHLCQNSIFHERTKNVNIQFHFMKELINDGAVKLEKVSNKDNPADIVTKVVPLARFSHYLKLVQVMPKK